MRGAVYLWRGPVEIASKLCRGGAVRGQRVVPLSSRIRQAADYAEQIISTPISTGGRSPLSPNAPNRFALRAEGVEYIFNVVRKDGTFIDKGSYRRAVPLDDSCDGPRYVKGTYYVFAGNDKAIESDRLNAFRKKATNLDFEDGSGSVPAGWTFDFSGNNGTLEWTTESPGAGEKCVRCDVPSDAKPSWIAARQLNVAIEPGAKYRFEAKVRGQGVTGQVGWYLHFGDAATEMLSSPMLYVNKEGDFDWTTLSGEYAAPEKADRLSFGTVLYGTGPRVTFRRLQKIDADRNSSTRRPSIERVPSAPSKRFWSVERLSGPSGQSPNLSRKTAFRKRRCDDHRRTPPRSGLVRLDLFVERHWDGPLRPTTSI